MHQEPSMLSVLLLLPNLRVASLRLYTVIRGHSQCVVHKEIPSATGTTMFLPWLKKFDLTSLQAGDRILSVLPAGLEQLAIIEYPDLLRRTDAQDDRFLRSLPVAFPSVRRLEIHQFIREGLDDLWNPMRAFQPIISQFTKLRVFALECDDPERRGAHTPRGLEYENVRHLRKLCNIAEEMVLLTPWLAKIRMATEWGMFYTGSRGKSSLLPMGKSYRPDFYAVLKGPMETAEEIMAGWEASDPPSDWVEMSHSIVTS
ncbi:hypothetical protein C8R44DRAFT_857834 [Mycena epipterygia]|nr:hypothetical protein C8R44DRAFT_857834 [Mycena epipterygia]